MLFDGIRDSAGLLRVLLGTQKFLEEVGDAGNDGSLATYSEPFPVNRMTESCSSRPRTASRNERPSMPGVW